MLGDLPSAAELMHDFPIYDYALVRMKDALYSLPLSGGPALPLGDSTLPQNDPLVISADGATLLVQRQDGLYRLPLAGGPAVPLERPPGLDRQMQLRYAAISPDGRQVIMAAMSPAPASWRDRLLAPRWTQALYAAPFAGGAPVRLTPPLDPDQTIMAWQISADGRRLVYAVATPDPESQVGDELKQATAVVALASVSLDGGTPAQLVLGSLGAPITHWQITPDGRHVLYEQGQPSALFSVPTAGGRVVALSANRPPAEFIDSVWTSPDSQYALYQTSRALYAAPVAGGRAVNLTSALPPGEDPLDAQVAQDSAQMVFLTRSALYLAPLRGGPATRVTTISPPPSAGGKLTLVGALALYQTDEAIYSVSLAGGAPKRLSGAPTPHSRLSALTVSADQRTVIYQVDRDDAPSQSVYAAPLGGGAPRRLFSGETTTFYASTNRYVIAETGGALAAAPLAGGPALPLVTTPQATAWTVIVVDDNRVLYTDATGALTGRARKPVLLATLP